MGSFQTPQAGCGERLIPVVIDELAQSSPNRPWASLPIDDDDLSRGFEDISYAALANAVNKLARFIESNFGLSSAFDTIAYFGVPDIRYHILAVAVSKTGHKVLFSASLNAPQVHLSLMEQTACNLMLSAAGVPVEGLLAARPGMSHAIVPSLDELLDLTVVVAPFPYTKTFAEAAQDPYAVLHTSGTTGGPKVCIYRHATLGAMDAQSSLPDVAGRSHLEFCSPGPGCRVLMVSMPYHAMSTFCSMGLTVFGGGVFLPGYRNKGVYTPDITDLLTYSRASKAVLMPWHMEDIARRPNAREYIEPLDKVIFVGGLVSPLAASIWAKYTQMQNGFGATEILAPAQLIADNEDYAYCFFDTVHAGIDFQLFKKDFLDDKGEEIPVYEMILTLSQKSYKYSGWHASNNITPRSLEGPPAPELGDLWTPHPDPEKAPYAWRFVARRDDMIVFKSAFQINPAYMEKSLAHHPLVRAAQVVGNGHLQPVLLVELAEGHDALEELVTDRIWEEAIQSENKKAPSHGRVARTHIVLVPAGSFPRTPKGTVSRNKAEAKYAREIDAVYSKFGDITIAPDKE